MGHFEPKNDKGHHDASCAVKAAIDFRREFEKVLKKWMADWTLYTPEKIDVGLGCGIHTGEVFVGSIGTDLRDQYTALGPNVNFASRIESRSGKGQILISSSTHARVKDVFDTQDAGAINDIKNIPGEFRLFSVIAAK